MVKFSDFKDPASWVPIAVQVRWYRETPERSEPPPRMEVAATLRLGKPPPPEVCEFIADLLEGKITYKRGRPRTDPKDSIRLLFRAMQVQHWTRVYGRARRMGRKFDGSPHQAALACVSKRTGMPEGALRKGLGLLNEFENCPRKEENP